MELIFTGEFPPMVGGIGNFIYSRCQSPPNDGIEILTPDNKYASEWDKKSDLSIERFDYQYGDSIKIRIKQIYISNSILQKKLKTNTYRLITNNHFFPFGFVSALNKRKYKIAIFCHGAEILRAQKSRLGKLLFTYTFKRADVIIANSKMTAELMTSLKIDRSKLVIINPPIDNQRFNVNINDDDNNISELKASLFNKNSFVMLTVSRLDDIGKGIDTVIKIMPNLLKKCNNLKYFIIGDGSLREYYRELIKENNLDNSTFLLGRISEKDLPNYYKICDVFILMSRRIIEKGYYEGFGIACKEAMACGKPVIISDEAGIKDYVTNGVNGLIVSPNNFSQIQDNILLLINNPELSKSIGKAAHSFASRPTDWSLLNTFR